MSVGRDVLGGMKGCQNTTVSPVIGVGEEPAQCSMVALRHSALVSCRVAWVGAIVLKLRSKFRACAGCSKSGAKSGAR